MHGPWPRSALSADALAGFVLATPLRGPQGLPEDLPVPGAITAFSGARSALRALVGHHRTPCSSGRSWVSHPDTSDPTRGSEWLIRYRASWSRRPTGRSRWKQSWFPIRDQGEVVVDIAACGVCHTDLHYVQGGIGEDFPFLLGHEAAGTVFRGGRRSHRVAPATTW